MPKQTDIFFTQKLDTNFDHMLGVVASACNPRKLREESRVLGWTEAHIKNWINSITNNIIFTYVFETGPHRVAQAGLKPMLL